VPNANSLAVPTHIRSLSTYFGLEYDAETPTYSAAWCFDISMIGTASRLPLFANEEVGEKSGAG
jgi:hypothetical protein